MFTKYRCIRSSIILLLCLSSYIGSQSGTWDVVDMRCDVLIRDLCILPTGQFGWAVGSTEAGGERLSCVLRTTDGGSDWHILPFADSIAVSLVGVFFASEDSGWVVGNSGRIYATSDGGNTWVLQSSGVTRNLRRVHFVNTSTGWVTGGWSDGNSYPVLKTTNGGQTWQNLSFGSDCYSCEDIFFSDSLNGWLCGYDASLYGHVHHTSDGGQNWVRQTIPFGSGAVSAIDFPSPAQGWATTSSLYQTPAGAILHTTDGGTNWTVQAYTYLHYNYCLDCRDTANVAIAAVQILSPAQEKIFVTSDGGQSWTQHTPPIVSYTYGIQYVDNSIWLGAANSQVVRSTDNGVSWGWEYYAPSWSSIAWSDLNSGWVVAGSYTGGQGYCSRSIDGGVSWFYDGNAPGGSQVFFVGADRGWMLKEGNNASVWRTTDGGGSWSQHAVGTGNWVGGIFFASADSGWAFGSNGTIRVTTDGGVSWAPQSSGTGNYVDVLYFVDADEGWAAGGYGGSNGFIIHTTNGGMSWIPQTPALTDHFDCGFFLDDQQGWLAGIYSRVQSTTDGGASWQVVGQVNNFYTPDMHMIDAQEGFLTAANFASTSPGEDGRGYIYRTTNGGSAWDCEYGGTRIRSIINDLGLKPDGMIWACGAHGAILRYNPLGIEGNDEYVVASGLAAFPNPFRSATAISYSLYENSRVRIEIYDALGRQVSIPLDRLQQEGEHSVVWRGRDQGDGKLPAGIYFTRLYVDDHLQGIGKLLLLE